MRDFITSCMSAFSRRGLLFAAMNMFYFSSILVAALLGQSEYLLPYEWPVGEGVVPEGLGSFPLMVAYIFFFDLVVSAFIFVTVSGLLFFALPLVVLLLRSALLGALLSALPTPLFLATIPILVLEGEAYVLGSIVGVNLGLSWLKPDWAFKSKELSRLEAFKMAWRECAYMYVLVAILLFSAAVVETVTITLTTGH